jgi:hypothetical protein
MFGKGYAKAFSATKNLPGSAFPTPANDASSGICERFSIVASKTQPADPTGRDDDSAVP